jgi:hypothetical protein
MLGKPQDCNTRFARGRDLGRARWRVAPSDTRYCIVIVPPPMLSESASSAGFPMSHRHALSAEATLG